MLDYLFFTCIAPLEWGMRVVLQWVHACSGSWGLAILGMSLAVNIALLPLYHLAEQWQEAERRAQAAMADKLAEIRAMFTGQERFMMIRTLYRQKRYHPILAVRTSFGFLIQVPFFFAAYHFLSNFAPLHGVAYGWLPNLAQPDALLALGTWHINVLPFVMTAINILSTQVYTQRLTRRETIQLYVVAGIFLVLLYTAPSGLVLYWTCNNIFSLFKNMVYNKLHLLDKQERSDASPAQAAAPRLILPSLAALLRRMGLTHRIFAMPLWPLLLAVLLCVAGLSAITSFTAEHGKPFALGLICVQAVCLALMLAHWCRRHERQGLFFILLSAGILLVSVVLFWKFVLPASNPPTKPPFLILLGALTMLAFVWCLRHAEDKVKSFPTVKLYHSSLLLVLCLVFLYSPATLYSSDPAFFKGNVSLILAQMTWIAALSAGLGALLLRVLTPGQQRGAALLMAFVATQALLYTFVVTKNYGPIDAYQFQAPHVLHDLSNLPLDLAVLTVAAVLLRVLGRTQRIPLLVGGFQCLAVAISVAALFNLGNPKGTDGGFTSIDLSPEATAAAKPPPYNDFLYSFSRIKENTLIIMLDTFDGGHIEYLLRDFPELHAQLDGFTWYSDTLTSGSATMAGMPAILGGATNEAQNLAQHTTESLGTRINAAYAKTLDMMAHQGTVDVSLIGPTSFAFEKQPSWVKEYTLHKDGLGQDYMGLWGKKRNYIQNKVPTATPFLIMAGIFRTTPFSQRKIIYSDGKWLNTTTPMSIDSALKFSALDIMADVSNTNSPRTTFKYIANETTHSPWGLDLDTGLPLAHGADPAWQSRYSKEGIKYPRLIANEYWALRALTDWFHWMKANGVYDNTRIIIVSDHSMGISPQLENILPPAENYAFDPWPYVLLLVKNTGERGNLRTDDYPMMNSDVPALICADLVKTGGNCGDISPFVKGDPSQRVRWHMTVDPKQRENPDAVVPHSIHRVTGPMFKKENWERIQ